MQDLAYVKRRNDKFGKNSKLNVIQSNPLDVGREMSVDIDVRYFNSRHCRLSKSSHSTRRHPSP